MVFDMTSTQHASRVCLQPELTIASISISLHFEAVLAQITKVPLLGEETASTIYKNNSLKVSKNYYFARHTADTSR